MPTWLYLIALSLAAQDIIVSLKEYQRALGLPETGNFRKRSETRQAYYRCYYTGKLELPDSYDQLRLADGAASGCPVNEEEYDVFFYAIEAVADGAAPVTASLERAPRERQAVVVAHEDLHERLHRLPVSLAEAAATLAGFVTAAQFARDTAGPDSELARALAAEADLFLRKSELVNRFHARLRELYARARAGEFTRRQALAMKTEAFLDLQRECLSLEPKPATFNRCPAALNNAGLAFDYTYTRHYPLFHFLFETLGRDLRSFLKTLDELAAGPRTEADVVSAVTQKIRRQTAGGSP